MIDPGKSKDVYSCVDQLIRELSARGDSHLAEVLHHRLHEVAWTTDQELFLELQKILSDVGGYEKENLTRPLTLKIEQILTKIQTSL